ncbi:MAG: alpha/beta hydrolase [Flavobacteriales bacterium]|nr:alpha/beta hydrolase [Flavobacteriales bacterium]
MKNLISLLILTVLFNSFFAQEVSIATRSSIESSILGEERFFNIYLPPSYHSNKLATYPVIYLMDGDYNFHHTTGLVEQLSSIGDLIPEVIVIGIADNGHSKYVNNCTPQDRKDNPKGQSEKFASFISTELKPHIKHIYRVSNCDILIGHSLGGLFVVNTMLSEPTSFKAYIAISPSLWWGDYEAEEKVDAFFKSNNQLNRHFYMSLANEKGMGVLGFQNRLDINTFTNQYSKSESLGLDYHFNQYPEENHNSVGLISVSDALKDLFHDHTLEVDQITSFEAYESMISTYATMIGAGFKIPSSHLSSLIAKFHGTEEITLMEKTIKEKFMASLGGFYHQLGKTHLRQGKKEEGMKLLEFCCSQFPASPEFIVSLAENSEKEKATKLYQKAYDLAVKQKARQWYINQLNSNIK